MLDLLHQNAIRVHLAKFLLSLVSNAELRSNRLRHGLATLIDVVHQVIMDGYYLVTADSI